MTGPARDSLFAAPQPLAEGERLIATFPADRGAYIRNHLILAVVFGALAGLVLIAMDNPDPWVGPVAALAAIGIRAAYLASEALAAQWRLTDRRLLGPGGRAVALADISAARPFFGDVQIVTRGGDKHLMKYLPDVRAVLDAIETARKART